MKLAVLVDKITLGTAAKTCLTDLQTDLNLTKAQEAVLQRLDLEPLLSQSQVEVKIPKTSSLFDVSRIKILELVECVKRDKCKRKDALTCTIYKCVQVGAQEMHMQM